MVVIVPISSPKSSTVGFGLPIKLDLTLPMALPSTIGPLPEGKHTYILYYTQVVPAPYGWINWVNWLKKKSEIKSPSDFTPLKKSKPTVTSCNVEDLE